MKQTSFSLAGLILSLLAIVGCNEDINAPKGCAENVQLSVSSDANPLFGWSPACGMSTLFVETVPPTIAGLPETMWAFSVPEYAPIGPYVRYGSAPERATVYTEAHALIVGKEYRVRVYLTVGGDVQVASGEAIFTH